MKATLLILLILVGGVSFWQVTASKNALKIAQDEAAKKIESAKKAETDLAVAKRELSDLEIEVASLKTQVEARDQRIAQLTDTKAMADAEDAKYANAREKALADQKAANAADIALQKRLAEMKTAYNEHYKSLSEQQATLTTNLTAAKAAKKTLEDNEPKFNEQGERISSVTGTRIATGVRTSQADREKAMELYRGQLASADAQINAINAELAKLEVRFGDLERSYQAAVEKATIEANAAR